MRQTSIIYLLGCIILLASGCKDFLTVAPADELSREDTFSSLRGTEAALIGLYNLLGDSPLYRDMLMFYPEMMGNAEPALSPGDDETMQGAAAETLIQAYDFRVSPTYDDSRLDDLYEDSYSILYQVNDILVNLPNLTEGAAARRASLRAEALTLRALMHLNLVRVFAQAYPFTPTATHPGIVLLEDVPEAEDTPKRASVAEVYAAIRQDLEDALDSIDNNWSERSSEPLWVNRSVILGLLVRTELATENWAAVVQYADDLLATTEATFTPNATYLNDWTFGQLRETIWEIDLSRLANPLSIGLGAFVGDGNDEPVIRISDDLFLQFAEDDLRRQLYPVSPEGNRLTDKYAILAGNSLRNPLVMRLSEIILSRAEAYYALGQEAAAQADVDQIIQRARPGTAPTTITGLDLRDLIRQERRLELALEGHYLFDLKRWRLDVTRAHCADFVTNCNVTAPDHRFALPIPQDALFRNPNLEQNDGY
ncbi:MAG: RagB/SusD family nutrient uptake outer membrane protein [Bacteroidota bacterium]